MVTWPPEDPGGLGLCGFPGRAYCWLTKVEGDEPGHVMQIIKGATFSLSAAISHPTLNCYSEFIQLCQKSVFILVRFLRRV